MFGDWRHLAQSDGCAYQSVFQPRILYLRLSWAKSRDVIRRPQSRLCSIRRRGSTRHLRRPTEVPWDNMKTAVDKSGRDACWPQYSGKRPSRTWRAQSCGSPERRWRSMNTTAATSGRRSIAPAVPPVDARPSLGHPNTRVSSDSSSLSITSTIKRARWFSGSPSSTAGGSS